MELGKEATGARVEGAPEGQAHEYFKAQMRICHRAREHTARLIEQTEALERRLSAIEGKKASADTRRDLLVASERLLDLEADWEDIQRRFNGATESLEEVFSCEVLEAEAAFAMPAKFENALREEAEALQTDLQQAEDSIVTVRRHQGVVHARHKNAVGGLATGARGTLVLGITALVAAGLGAAGGILFGGVDPTALVFSLLPAWLGLLVLFLNARAKSL
jgi:hypothetical protein